MDNCLMIWDSVSAYFLAAASATASVKNLMIARIVQHSHLPQIPLL